MGATETRVQLSILGYLFSDLKKAGVRSQLSVISYQLSVISSLRKHPTSPLPTTPHPTPHFPTCHFPEKAYSAIQAKKNETFALRISPDW
ncbi:MAG: hypothetical protein EWV83_01060 [Microcystis sp. M_OC_Ca_00000000_S217Cul]|nr:MAG: hypothetical protein EWV83_01060 [Microcystis sp. M_OC_Ca_00000000_S217Cul]TRT91805.1 MAG: hypothetical protein EWV66_05490 [Microcystis sp. M_OC_Ca_00000000_C217Col]